MTAHLIVPGFNGGNPMKLLNFDCSPVMRAAGGGPLARDLDDHLEHPRLSRSRQWSASKIDLAAAAQSRRPLRHSKRGAVARDGSGVSLKFGALDDHGTPIATMPFTEHGWSNLRSRIG
jgi:hypothetical protein